MARAPDAVVLESSGNRRQQFLCVGSPGVAEYALAVAGFHYLSLLHHHDGVGDIRATTARSWLMKRSRRYHASCCSSAISLKDLRLDGDIQGRGGLVGDQQPGFVDQPWRHHPLAHAAGKTRGEVVDGRLGVADAYLSSSSRRRALASWDTWRW